MRVLIVDDEPIILRSIKSLTKQLKEYWNIDTCLNAAEAKEYILKNNYDILITDINLPVINGLELAEWCKRKNPSILIAIISAYSEFDYAQKAMTLDIKNYVLKPINVEQFSVVLDSLEKEYFDKKETEFRDLLSQYPPINSVNIDINAEGSLDGFYLIPLIVCAGPLAKNFWMQKQIGAKKSDIISKSGLLVFLKEQLFPDQWIWCFDGPLRTLMIIIIEAKAAQELDLEKKQNTLANWLTNNKSLTVALGKRFSTISEIADFRAQVMINFPKFIQLGRSCLIDNNSIKSKNHGQSMINFDGTRTYTCFWNNIFKNTIPKKTNWFKIVETWEKYNLTQDQCERELQKFIYVGKSIIRDIGTDINYEEHLIDNLYYFLIKGFEASLSWEEFEYESLIVIDDFRSNMKNYLADDPRNKQKQLAIAIKNYLELNFQKRITNEELSENFFYSVVHISNVFKDTYDCTPLDYLHQYRINKAKYLLIQNQSLSIAEVGSTCGFPDPSYFSKVFKKETGFSPDAYRKYN